jgi:hypothetical protein
MARTRKYYLKNNYLTLRSKVKVLSGKTKKLWSGQALLRRSGRSRRNGIGRKNQNKTICLPSLQYFSLFQRVMVMAFKDTSTVFQFVSEG